MAPVIRFKVTVTHPVPIKQDEGLVSSSAKSWTTRDFTKYTVITEALDTLGITYVVTTDITDSPDRTVFGMG